jgi:hypothetical protein
VWGRDLLPFRPVWRQSYTSSSSSFFLTPTMTRFVRSQYISTFCFCSIASLAASALPGSTTPVVRALTALPGTLDSGCVDERAAASLVLSVVFSFCAVLSESASFLFSAVRVVFVFVRAATDLFREVSSEVRDWRSATCCLSALMTASWSAGVSLVAEKESQDAPFATWSVRFFSWSKADSLPDVATSFNASYFAVMASSFLARSPTFRRMAGSRSVSDTLPARRPAAEGCRVLLAAVCRADGRAEGRGGGGMLSGISSTSIESSMSIGSASGSACVSGIVNVSGSAPRLVDRDLPVAFVLVSFFAVVSFGAALRPRFAGAGSSSAGSSSCAFFALAGRPRLAGFTGSATSVASSSSSSSASSASLSAPFLRSASALRPTFAGAFFAATASFFASAARAAGLPLAVAFVAETVLVDGAAFPRALRAGALFSVFESGVGIALSSSYVISSSDAESTVKEMFAIALRGAIAAVIWALRLEAVEAAIVAGRSCDRKWDVNNTNTKVRARRGSACSLALHLHDIEPGHDSCC